MSSLLEVRDLSVHFPTSDGLVKAVNEISFSVERGKTLGIVGESGSGKSVTSLAIMGLHKGSKAQVTGEILLNGEDINLKSEAEMRNYRGRDMAMIFQDSLASLHPFFRVGDQIAEAYSVHNKVSKSDAHKRAVEMLERVGIPNPDKRVNDYPHQFSGGMRQRAMIAMALSCNPSLIIADEPTTALDVTIQAQILDLLKDLQQEFGMSIILITHDLGVVAQTADDMLIMYAGRIVEQGSVREVMHQPIHPYALGLLDSIPQLTSDPNIRLQPIPGTPPSLINLPDGCAFYPRCKYSLDVKDRCTTELPQLMGSINNVNHRSACHIPIEQRMVWARK